MNNRLGFTLIELLVVITIIGLFIGWSTTNYSRSRERQNLQSAVSSLRSQIDNIRLGSTSLLLPQDVVLSAFQGYGFTVNSATNTLTRFYLQDSVTHTQNTYEISQFKNVELIDPDNSSVYFTHSSGELMDLFNTPTDIIILLKNTYIDQCTSLSINQLGIITTNDQVICP